MNTTINLELFKESVIHANSSNSKDTINSDLELKYDLIYDIDEDEDETENCTYCGAKLKNHVYGNICEKHIPSYALWDNTEDSDSNYSAFYEEIYERKLAIELDEYDCGQCSDIESSYEYEYEDFEESYDFL